MKAKRKMTENKEQGEKLAQGRMAAMTMIAARKTHAKSAPHDVQNSITCLDRRT